MNHYDAQQIGAKHAERLTLLGRRVEDRPLDEAAERALLAIVRKIDWIELVQAINILSAPTYGRYR